MKNHKLKILIILLAVLIAATGCVNNDNTKEENINIIPLTDIEIESFNESFKPILVDEQGIGYVNPISNFFTSYYDKPEDINLAEFLSYFTPDRDVQDGDEFDALKNEKNWPFGTDRGFKSMPVPIHAFHVETINKELQKYMGITLDDINDIGTENLIFLEEYNAYYNFTSDFAAGVFQCTRGETEGNIVRLFSESVTLTLRKHDDDYLILSHQLSAKD